MFAESLFLWGLVFLQGNRNKLPEKTPRRYEKEEPIKPVEVKVLFFNSKKKEAENNTFKAPIKKIDTFEEIPNEKSNNVQTSTNSNNFASVVLPKQTEKWDHENYHPSDKNQQFKKNEHYFEEKKTGFNNSSKQYPIVETQATKLQKEGLVRQTNNFKSNPEKTHDIIGSGERINHDVQDGFKEKNEKKAFGHKNSSSTNQEIENPVSILTRQSQKGEKVENSSNQSKPNYYNNTNFVEPKKFVKNKNSWENEEFVYREKNESFSNANPPKVDETVMRPKFLSIPNESFAMKGGNLEEFRKVGHFVDKKNKQNEEKNDKNTNFEAEENYENKRFDKNENQYRKNKDSSQGFVSNKYVKNDQNEDDDFEENGSQKRKDSNFAKQQNNFDRQNNKPSNQYNKPRTYTYQQNNKSHKSPFEVEEYVKKDEFVPKKDEFVPKKNEFVPKKDIEVKKEKFIKEADRKSKGKTDFGANIFQVLERKWSTN